MLIKKTYLSSAEKDPMVDPILIKRLAPDGSERVVGIFKPQIALDNHPVRLNRNIKSTVYNKAETCHTP